MEKKYLYWIEQCNNNVYRAEISKETETNIWIKIRENYEIKISKKIMKTGNGYNSIFYYYETPIYLENYKKTILKHKYYNQLKLLQNCTDENIMIQIINIKIPVEKEGNKI
jgi:hypothetical protein